MFYVWILYQCVLQIFILSIQQFLTKFISGLFSCFTFGSSICYHIIYINTVFNFTTTTHAYFIVKNAIKDVHTSQCILMLTIQIWSSWLRHDFLFDEEIYWIIWHLLPVRRLCRNKLSARFIKHSAMRFNHILSHYWLCGFFGAFTRIAICNVLYTCLVPSLRK